MWCDTIHVGRWNGHPVRSRRDEGIIMAAAPLPSASAGTLPADVITEVQADWGTDPVKSGAEASCVTFPLDRGPDGALLRSNRGFDVLQVARTAAGTRKGYKVGTRTVVNTVTDAVDEVLNEDGSVKKEGVPAVCTLTVFTYWKPAA